MVVMLEWFDWISWNNGLVSCLCFWVILLFNGGFSESACAQSLLSVVWLRGAWGLCTCSPRVVGCVVYGGSSSFSIGYSSFSINFMSWSGFYDLVWDRFTSALFCGLASVSPARVASKRINDRIRFSYSGQGVVCSLVGSVKMLSARRPWSEIDHPSAMEAGWSLWQINLCIFLHVLKHQI